MNKFDTVINNRLAKKIAKAKKKIRRKIERVLPPNTPGNRPVSQGSPAMARGIDKEVVDSPI